MGGTRHGSTSRRPCLIGSALTDYSDDWGFPALLAHYDGANYLRLRSHLTTQTAAIASAESELSQLKADNDALYNTAMASVDLEQVRKTAISELGMQYPTEEQIITFDTAGNSYVRQYQDVPGTK